MAMKCEYKQPIVRVVELDPVMPLCESGKEAGGRIRGYNEYHSGEDEDGTTVEDL